MNLLFKAALVASALTLLPLSTAAPAAARTTVAFDFGNVRVGYRDGYWDNGHRWHRWAHRRDAIQYRAQYHDNYQHMYHYRARNHGWRDR